MIKNSRTGFIAASAVGLMLPYVVAAQNPLGAATFASRCAVCHGPQAAGIPGTFPSLHEQIVDFARTAAGRDYLVMVVSGGLMGELTIGNSRYNNVMPAQSGLSEDEVAAVLNYLAADLGKNADVEVVLSAASVKEIRARHGGSSPQSTRALRPATAP